MATTVTAKPKQITSGLGFFERYLPLWVALCMGAGVILGKLLPGFSGGLRGVEFVRGSHINAPIAVPCISDSSAALPTCWIESEQMRAPVLNLPI